MQNPFVYIILVYVEWILNNQSYYTMYGGVGPELRFGDRKDSDLVSLEYSSFFQFEKEPHHKQQIHCHTKPQVICV